MRRIPVAQRLSLGQHAQRSRDVMAGSVSSVGDSRATSDSPLYPGTPAPGPGVRLSAQFAKQTMGLVLLRLAALGENLLEHGTGAIAVTQVEIGPGQIEFGICRIVAEG